MRVRDVPPNGFRSTLLWVYTGAGLFLLALLLSAIVVPDLRVLHSLQAVIYIAVIVLARRNSPWGYGAGLAIALLWNSMGFFITHLVQRGAVTFWLLLRTGHAGDLVPMAVTLGAIGHLILIAATILAMIRFAAEPRKWWKFVGGGALSLAYFALLVALFGHH